MLRVNAPPHRIFKTSSLLVFVQQDNCSAENAFYDPPSPPPSDASVADAGSPTVENVELSFVEEPLGLRADQGYGYLQVDFGDRIGPVHGPRPRYEILRKLGWGMNASVWLARDHAEERYVAVKALKGMSTDLHYRGYIQELDIMTGPEQSWDYLVEAAVSQPLPPLTGAGPVRIADFGSAQILTHPVTSHITPETLRAPEVIMHLPWDAKVDIWTFGCLVYEFLLGVPLFSRKSGTGIADPHSHHLAEMLAFTGENLPVELPSDAIDQYPTTHFSVLVKNGAEALGIPEHDVVGSIDLMSRCLRIDPACRPTSIQLARQSPWLLELGDDFWTILSATKFYWDDTSNLFIEDVFGALACILCLFV
ncbi:kinase-like domain-containing protein [Mycena maculata]|uniref:Kinase-like domain-containing protein n=1 Tax=Mycena maculata TaxID=230809 RepID=A0AAD7IBP0_9AGAR|nr:kinase-like domain-containing protein [Mycena maculata]